MQTWELELMIFVSPTQLRIFCDFHLPAFPLAYSWLLKGSPFIILEAIFPFVPKTTQ